MSLPAPCGLFDNYIDHAGCSEYYLQRPRRSRKPMQMTRSTSKASLWLFLITFSMVFYGTGASFIESFVNYPTWPLVGPDEFRAFHQALGPRIIGFMVVPMFVTTILTILLLWFRPAAVPRWAIWLSVILQLLTWISTAAIQIPIQVQLSTNGLSLPLIERLISTNLWFRRLPHLVNTFLFFWMMFLLLFRENSEKRQEA